jgi:branched-chain amino acid aminotransferase
MLFANFNGKIILEEAVSISPSNRSFRYGDGFFETLKVKQGNILLAHLHEERILKSLELLRFQMPKLFNLKNIFEEIVHLAIKNNHQQLARVRVVFFRGNGGLYDVENHIPNYVIQTYSLSESLTNLNTNGLVLDVYTHGKKAIDDFCNIKSNSFLPYTMAAIWAKENKLNDAIILNSKNTIADTTIANIFILKDSKIFTPSLQDACIAGVSRAFLIKSDLRITEKSITPEELLNADEVFVTNAIRGVQWIKQIGNASFNLGPRTIEISALMQKIGNK